MDIPGRLAIYEMEAVEQGSWLIQIKNMSEKESKSQGGGKRRERRREI